MDGWHHEHKEQFGKRTEYVKNQSKSNIVVQYRMCDNMDYASSNEVISITPFKQGEEWKKSLEGIGNDCSS